MKKICVSIFFVFSCNVSAMETKELLLRSAAGIGGTLCLAGVPVSHRWVDYAMTESEHIRSRGYSGAARADADTRCLARVTTACLLRAGSLVQASLLFRYACTGKLPPHNTQTYLSALAIVSGAVVQQMARVVSYNMRDRIFDEAERPSNVPRIMSLVGLGFTLGGAYAFFKNKN